MTSNAHKLHPFDKKLTLEFVLQEMAYAGLVDKPTAEQIYRQNSKSADYPLVVIAKFGVKDRRPPHLPLTLEILTEWLAKRVGYPYFEIDPLKIDIKAVASVVSTAYARRLQVIPVKVEKSKIVVATA
ncbi:MAG: type II/IV secretion system protein, partial [Deltaproteobacteria bacterium]|nr:type II/IV secretion system protein [Deltaproteobacteria bacterium]